MEKKLRRTTGTEKMLFGICGGLAKFFQLDATLIRILWVILTVFAIGSPVIIYVLMAFIVPSESSGE